MCVVASRNTPPNPLPPRPKHNQTNDDDNTQPRTSRRSAACDGRAADVFGSVFYLPPPRALNWMVKDAYGGPTLVLQGVLDPLNDAGA